MLWGEGKAMIESRQIVTKSTVRVRGGMVTAMHPAAARAGGRVLKRGGTAVDAFLAAALAIGVAEPFMSGLGGHGSIIIARPGAAPIALDFTARAPVAASKPDAPVSFPFTGARAVPTPTAAVGLATLAEQHATWDPVDLARDAIQMARDGLPLEGYTAGMIAHHAGTLACDAGARSTFLDAATRPLRPSTSAQQPGDRLRLPAYARTLGVWARKGAEAFTHGSIADELVSWMQEHNGFVAEEDLRGLKLEHDDAPFALPLSTPAGEVVIHGAPGMSGFSCVAQALRILEDLDPVQTPFGSISYYHRLAEAFRVAFFDRLRWLGDPHGPDAAPLTAFADPALAQIRRSDLDPERRVSELPVRDLLGRYEAIVKEYGEAAGEDLGCTTHLCVLDRDGVAVSGTLTLGHPFGAGVVVPGPGLMLLNTLYQFNDAPGHPNALVAGRRAVWNGSPIVVTRDNRPFLTLGAPGAQRIPTALVQVLLALLWYRLHPQASIDAPRLHTEGGALEIDDRVNTDVLEGLRRCGHKVVPVREGVASSNFARPGVIVLDDQGIAEGGIDAWRLGTVVGVNAVTGQVK